MHMCYMWKWDRSLCFSARCSSLFTNLALALAAAGVLTSECYWLPCAVCKKPGEESCSNQIHEGCCCYAICHTWVVGTAGLTFVCLLEACLQLTDYEHMFDNGFCFLPKGSWISSTCLPVKLFVPPDLLTVSRWSRRLYILCTNLV